jgi:hypothetical protein
MIHSKTITYGSELFETRDLCELEMLLSDIKPLLNPDSRYSLSRDESIKAKAKRIRDHLNKMLGDAK